MHYFIYLFFCLTRCAGSNTHSYKKRAKIITEVLNSVENVKCNEVAGAMYAFPRITLPKQAIEAATLSVLFPALIFRTALQNNIMGISLEVGHVMPIVLNKVIRIPESWALVSEFSSSGSPKSC